MNERVWRSIRNKQELNAKEIASGCTRFMHADSALFTNKSLYDEDIEPATDRRDKTIILSPGTEEEEEENSLTESAEGQRSSSDREGRLQRLDSERSQLMKDAERDEQQRHWFYKQLSSITHKMEGLNMADKNGPEQERARRLLEQEATQVQAAMVESLGPGQASQLRQEARLARIRSLEKEIRSLQTQGSKQSTKDVRDVATLTNLSKEVSKTKLDFDGQVAGGYVLDRTVSRGGHRISLATQTGEVRPADSSSVLDGVAPGMPFNPNLYHGAWPIEKGVSSRHGPLSSSSDGAGGPKASGDLASVISFNSTNSSSTTASNSNVIKQKMMAAPAQGNSSSPGGDEQPQQLGSKVEMVYSLLSMLGTHDKDDMSRTLFAMSQSQDSCLAMRQSGCLPLLLQLLHGSDKDSGLLGKTRGSKAARARAAAALHNIVHCQHDDKRARREARTLRLLEQIRAHCDQRRQGEEGEEDDDEEAAEDGGSSCKDMDHHAGAAILALMRLSFDEEYRLAICTLGGLQAIAELLEIDNKQASQDTEYSTTVRRYACMALTNLTFGDGKNKALLCSMKGAMGALVAQLASQSEDLIQAAASVLRNLSWRADLASKKTLREIGAVTTLMQAAMAVKKETTLKSILSALWNLSSHCSENKAEICTVDGALRFLVSLLTYKSQAKTLAIVENGGGILRNVSSQVAIREDYRQILRSSGCLQLLLQQLRSTSLTIVSNACGTLWNLSARCAQDQTALRDMGAVAMLRNLVHSKHKMISSGSSAALRNLLASVPEGEGGMSGAAGVGGHSSRPSLHARKQRALEEELASQNLAETCENVESPRNSPIATVTSTSSSLTVPGSRSETVEGSGNNIHRSESEPRRFVYNHMNNSNSSVGSDVGSPVKSEDDGRRHMTRRQMIPRNGADPGSGSGNPKRVLSPQCVARAGSQDSVGSTHSDISHDRRRAHSMLARSSQLLNKRQGSSSTEGRGTAFPPGSADHKMMVLQQQQHQLQQQLLQQQQHQHHQQQSQHLPSSSQSSYAPTSGFSPALINNTPAHSSRRPQQQQQQQHHYPQLPYQMMGLHHQPPLAPSVSSSTFSHPSSQQAWQPHTSSAPNSRIVQYMQEVAMYAGVTPLHHNSSSLTQSAPTSQSLALHSSGMYSNTLPASLPSSSSSANLYYQQQQQQQQQALLERLGKSSMVASLSSSGVGGQLHLNVDDDADDQPVNYSLKYQDVASSSSQPSPSLDHYSGHMTSSVQGVATTSSDGTFRVNPELLRVSGLSTSFTEQTPGSSATQCSSGSVMVNPALLTSPMQHRRPMPNLMPNRFSTPQSNMMYRSGGGPAGAVQFMTPQGSAAYRGGYSMGQRFPHPTLSSSHPADQIQATRSFSLPSSAHQPGNPMLSRSAMQASLTAYAETDLDLDDQPTDFSLRYSEEEVADDSNPPVSTRALRHDYHPPQEEQPINYSLRFHREEALTTSHQEQQTQKKDAAGAPNCVECRYAEARRTNEQLDNSSNDDQVRTFCTEGTPYLSTATSLTDLAQVGKHEDDEEEEEAEEELEEKEGGGNMDNASNVRGLHHQHVQGCRHQAMLANKTTTLNDTGSSSATGGNLTLVDPDRTLTPADAERSKGEMDLTASSSGSQATDRHTGSTVIAAGRTGSSLSSKADSVDTELQETQQSFHSDANEVPLELPSIDIYRLCGLAVRDQEVEETPLMFSRSSSPESLSSFDTQSVHSSVISEYSRRASQVVSPSEIPDSPSESMPSSPPRRAHSPTRRFRDHLNNFSSTPKSTNVLAKQSLDMNRTPAALRSEPFMNFAAFDETNKPLDFTNRKLSGLSMGVPSAGKIAPSRGLMLHNFPAFDDEEEDDQPINFSSRDQESQQQPPLTFSTFQKNIPPPAAHQQGAGGGMYMASSSGNNNNNSTAPARLLTPRGKSSLPTLVEQSVAENAETESSSGKSEVPVVYAEEGTPPNMSETTSLSGITMDHMELERGDETNATPSSVIIKGMAGLTLDSVPAAANLSSLQNHQREQAQISTSGLPQEYPSVGNQVQLGMAQHQQWQQDYQAYHHQQPGQVISPPTMPQPVAVEPNLPKFTQREESADDIACMQTSDKSLQSAPQKEIAEGLAEELRTTVEGEQNSQEVSGDKISPVSPKTPAAQEGDKQDERDSSMSEVSEGEEDILAQCISSGMPTPSASSARKMRRSSSDNTIKKRSGIPTKAESTPAASSSSKAGPSSSKHASSPSSSKHTPSSSKQSGSSSQSPKVAKPSAIPSASPQKSSKAKYDKASGGSRIPGSHDQSSHTPPPQSIGKPQPAAQSHMSKPHARAPAGATGKSSASKNLNPALNRAAANKSSEGLQKRLLQSPAKSAAGIKPTGAATVIPQNAASMAAHSEDQYADFSRDCVKSYATEGTPVNFSAATSLSDLSILTHSSSSPSNKKSSSSSKSPGETDSKSDNSSLCEENEELLLSQMIEQGMPKGRSSGRRHGGGGGGDNSGGAGGSNDGGAAGGKKQNSKDCNTSAFVPRMSNLRVVAPFHDFVPAADTVKTYNVEGTPRNFSAATSLSDLTIDSIEGPARLGKATAAAVGGGGSKVTKAPQPQASYVSGPFSPPPSDSLHTYNLEGSPLAYSHNASSLSSLGDELEPRGAGSGVSASPHKDNSGSLQMYPAHHAAGATTGDLNESDSSSSIPRERHIVGQSSEDSSIAGDNAQHRGRDHPVQYTVEDTPVTFSRNSSLSSLNSLDKGDNQLPQTPGTSGVRRQEAETNPDRVSDEEDDLADCDPTPSEQALLDQCIISAMPKSRLPRGDERARRHSRAKFLTQRVTRNTSRPGSSGGGYDHQTVAGSTVMGGSSPDGLDKSGEGASSSFLENTLTNGYHSSSEVDSGSQLSLEGDVSHMMTRSCSDTTELCLDFDTSPAAAESFTPSRQSRYGIWKRQRHRSSDGSEIRGNLVQQQQQRSHSQEASLKMHKDMSNKLARDSHGRQVRMEPQQHQAQVVSDFAAKVREISKDSMAGLVALKDDVDIDRAVFSRHGTLEVAAERQDKDEDISDAGDVTLRSGSAGTYPPGREADIQQGGIEGDDNYMYEYVEDAEPEEDRDNENVESFNSELLEENVRLIVSEIQSHGKTITSIRSLGSSTVDEDLFLENETISLVSNDAFSDTNSELSVEIGGPASVVEAAAVPPKTGRPKILKPGEVAIKEAKTAVKKVEDSPPEGKGIRGRRKPLYPGKTATPQHVKAGVHSKTAGVVKPSMGKGANTTASSPRLAPLSANASASCSPSGLKKTSPRSQKVAHVSPTPRVNQNGRNPTAVTSRTSSVPANNAGGAGVKGRTGAASIQKPSSASSGSSPPQLKNGARARAGVSPHSGSSLTRSPPTQSNKPTRAPSKGTSLPKPSAQATNAKQRSSQQARDGSVPSVGSSKKAGAAEASQANVPQHNLSSLDNKENKGQQPQTSVVVTMREKKNQSALSSSNRHSNCSQEGGSDGSSGSHTSERPNSWGKALDSYNFYVDETQDGQAYKQIQNQRNSRDAPSSIKRSLKTPSAPSAQQPAGSSPSQSRLPTVANKSNRSTSRTGIASRSPSGGRGTSAGKAGSKLNQQQVSSGRGRGSIPTKTLLHKSNDSLKSQSRPLTPVGRRSSSNSSGSGIPTPRRTVEGSSPSSPAVNGRRAQAPSKIASLRRRDGSLDNSPSSGSSTSSSASPPQSSRLPTKQTHTPSRSLPPSGVARHSTKKAATLPAGSSLEQAVAATAAAGVSKSSTFEKLSSSDKPAPPPVVISAGLREEEKVGSFPSGSDLSRASGSFDSPETGVRRGEVFELCDDNADEGDYDDVYEGTDDDPDASAEIIPVFEDYEEVEPPAGLALNTSGQSLLVESAPKIDTGTYRRKKPASDFELPNADETCKSMCSFNESMVSPAPLAMSQQGCRIVSSGSSSNSINEHATTINTSSISSIKAEEKTKGKSKVAQGLKRLFGSGRGKTKDSDKPSNSGKSGKKSSKWDRKHSKDLDFFSRNIKMEPSTLVGAEDDHLFHTSGIHLRTGGSTSSDHKSSPSAIVTPFNYSPPSTTHYTSSNSGVMVVDLNDSIDHADNASILSSKTGSNPLSGEDGGSDRALTKTEILIARRNAGHGAKTTATPTGEDVNNVSSASGNVACMITTV
ncbi:adenomatous polyposis coli [Elysia marginata]|uniref:Adenomatous polyposis coli n=1 Tax=Elysia marginata TaxID=1093978 RepID=A0AAV4HRB0_9GAST|nr:adenomatous polyposis coli [Elysia marginata]